MGSPGTAAPTRDVGWAAVVQAARSLENATRWINEAFEEAFRDIRQD
jgi:hypothetical protein